MFRLCFRWIAIPWMQKEVDEWKDQRNRNTPRRHRHKFLPHGIPLLIRGRPQDFNVLDFKVYIYANCFLTI